jgi:dihydroorotase
MTYDLVIKNGTVIDPSQGLHARKDVAVAGGRIRAIEDHISDGNTHDVIEADGLVVAPGLIDLHVHVWWGVAHLGVEADPVCVHRGVTTAIDAGSAGANTIAGFHRYVMERSHTRLLAFLHISGMGQLDLEIGELQDMRWARVDRAVEAATLHSDRIVGIKVRLTESIVGDNDIAAIRLASEAAAEIGKPLMIHMGRSAHPLEDLFSHLRSGDIVTHSFADGPNGILDDRGKVKDVAWDAARRGVVFDVGHGAGSFSFDVQEKAIEDGFWPGTVSSDIHRYNVRGPVFDLLTTLSKYLYLGRSLDEVIEMSTTRPARAVELDSSIGTLQLGAEADVSIIEVREGPVTLTDSKGATRQGDRLLVPVETLRNGRRFTPHALPGPTG